MHVVEKDNEIHYERVAQTQKNLMARWVMMWREIETSSSKYESEFVYDGSSKSRSSDNVLSRSKV